MLLLVNSYVSAQNAITYCKPGYVALTFDDGPNVYTGYLLDVLSQENVPATFFVNGENFLSLDDDEAKKVLLRAHKEGHQIASHTWSHKDLTTISGREFDSEVNALENAVSRIIGERTAFIRPPYGSTNDRVQKRLTTMGYKVALWSTDTQDYLTHDLESETTNIKESLNTEASENGPIVLSHDVHQQTAHELAGEMIRIFKEKGFKFATVAQCVDASPYK
ncbi:Peptidoglycan-N-acetylglucosamine deacetylase [Choanephora cucurbitarum]|uniref:Peptidoglycan-N-acetylglucosamine deacetylase n=1 Tax=Choanephora cucurbitarum TaxID=101091 RepID=A0A1C7NF60_9FUNG|nr:Peptidoglycan-N-acetylglucosamine deacetylase [Choanephora cucurbitarum]